MFGARSNLINSQVFGTATFDSVSITNSGIALDIYDNASASVFRVNAGNSTTTVSNLNITGSFSAGSSPITLADGAEDDPLLNFTNSANTGLYFTGTGGTNEMGFTHESAGIFFLNKTTGIRMIRELKMSDSGSSGNIKIGGVEDADSNVSIGYTAGAVLNAGGVTGNHNILMGYKAGVLSVTGNDNIAIGKNVMSLVATTGVGNILIGENCGNALLGGGTNICIGKSAGATITAGSGNILIGENAAPSAVGASDELVIQNATSTLITGDFAASTLHLAAGVSNKIRIATTATVTVTSADYVVRCTYSSGAITLNLPAIVVGKSQSFVIINDTTTPRVVTITSSVLDTSTIDDASTTAFPLSFRYDRATLMSDGVANGVWYTV